MTLSVTAAWLAHQRYVPPHLCRAFSIRSAIHIAALHLPRPCHRTSNRSEDNQPSYLARSVRHLYQLHQLCSSLLVSCCHVRCQYYTRCGTIGTADMYVDDSYGGKGSHYKFLRSDIVKFIQRAAQYLERPATTPPKMMPLFSALTSIRHILRDGSVLVMGSQEPWYEAVGIAYGAKQVVTMEYNNLTYAHEQIITTTPDRFHAALNATTARRSGAGDDSAAVEAEGGYSGPLQFDVVLAIACVDHDGLGRYGDPIAPDGDLLTMDTIQSYIKPPHVRLQEYTARRAEKGKTVKAGKRASSGVLVMSAPIGPDLVVWNLERRYGTVRLPLLLGGWEMKNRYGWNEAKLTEEASYRMRFEPVFVMSPDSHRVQTAENATETRSTSRDEL